MKLFGNSMAKFNCCGQDFFGSGDQVDWDMHRGKFKMHCPKCGMVVLSDIIVADNKKAKPKGDNYAKRKRGAHA